MKTIVSTCAPGPYLFRPVGIDGAEDEPFDRWCNAHIAPLSSNVCKRAQVVIDTEHPMYGTLATLVYPSDRYPYVVVGGSAGGKTLHFARVENLSGTEAVVNRDFALKNYRTSYIMTLRQSKNNPNRYGDSMFLGSARYYLAREV